MSAQNALPRGVWLMVAALWGAFLVGMYQAGKLQLFQASPYYDFTGAAGVILLLLAAKGALWPTRAGGVCGDDPRPWAGLRGHLVLVLLLLPVTSGVLVEHHAMMSLAAAKRSSGDALDSADILSALARQERRWAQGDEDYLPVNPLEALQIGQDNPGLQVRMVAFVTRPSERLKDRAGVFRAARFRMVCCAADALPVTVLVRHAKPGTIDPKQWVDQWVKVRGQVAREVIAGGERTVIVVDPAARPGTDQRAGDGVVLTPAPANPYFY